MTGHKGGAGKQRLGELLQGVDYTAEKDITGIQVSGITADSRQVKPGALFVAVRGHTVDGHRFVNQAVARGCGALLVERGGCALDPAGLPACVEVADTRAVLGRVAAAYFGHPAEELRMIGITGTNGKTTSAYLIENVIRAAGGNPGVIGTVNYRYNDIELPAPFTTPEPILLQQLLRKMADAGVTHVVMEVSSHALEQKRLAGLRFDVAVFTNLSRDHLDFHGDMARYYQSKKRLFLEYLKPSGKAVIVRAAGDNAQPDWGSRLVDELPWSAEWQAAGRKASDIIVCGGSAAAVAAESFHEDLAGMEADIGIPGGSLHLNSRLVGEFNLKNLLGAAGVGLALGTAPGPLQKGLARTRGVPGRLEQVDVREGIGVFVDYAHTPDALENVLRTLRKLTRKRLIVVFGCGGDRDRGKRPLMGRVAGQWADIAIVTSDNPRTEAPERIVADIERGLQDLPLARMRAEVLLGRSGLRGYDVIISRRQAIAVAVRNAGNGDVVLISGKGHEDYQITRQGKAFFDDRLEAARHRAVVDW